MADATLRWVIAGSWSTCSLGTELNSLSDDTAVLGAEISNDQTSERQVGLLLDLKLASLTPTADGMVEIYLLSKGNGGAFADGSASVDPSPSNWLHSFALTTATAAKRIIMTEPKIIGPLDFRLLLYNRAGVAFGSSGNELTYQFATLFADE